MQPSSSSLFGGDAQGGSLKHDMPLACKGNCIDASNVRTARSSCIPQSHIAHRRVQLQIAVCEET